MDPEERGEVEGGSAGWEAQLLREAAASLTSTSSTGGGGHRGREAAVRLGMLYPQLHLIDGRHNHGARRGDGGGGGMSTSVVGGDGLRVEQYRRMSAEDLWAVGLPCALVRAHSISLQLQFSSSHHSPTCLVPQLLAT